MDLIASFPQYASDLLIITVKVAYPLWASFKAIKSTGSSDDTTWLIYWVVMSLASFAECYLVPFVQWVPFFMLARLVFYIWLQLPVCNGSIFLFKKLVYPFFKNNKAVMEAVTIEDSKDATQTIADIRKLLRKAYFEILAALE